MCLKKRVLETESESEMEDDYSMFLQMSEGTSRQSAVKSKAFKKLAKSSRSRQSRQKPEENSEQKKVLPIRSLRQRKT